jgi:hypothetical protein
MVRRRRLATSASIAVVLALGVVLATQPPAHSHDDRQPSSHAGAAPTIAANMTAVSLHHAIAAYVAKRHGAVSASVYDRVSKKLVVIRPKVRGRTASIVKVDILETLLHRTGGHLSEDQRETAKSMIENSNNDSATDLWNQDGGAPGVDAYNDDLGLTQTAPNEDWGLTTTSASDQVALVRELFHRSSLLTTSARHFERMLMRHVEADQRWGISGGVPSNAVVGNKNGWLPVNADHDRWVVNSIGWVHGDRKSYVIAVITQHDANEDYGIDTIQHIARLVWDHATVAHSK